MKLNHILQKRQSTKSTFSFMETIGTCKQIQYFEVYFLSFKFQICIYQYLGKSLISKIKETTKCTRILSKCSSLLIWFVILRLLVGIEFKPNQGHPLFPCARNSYPCGFVLAGSRKRLHSELYKLAFIATGLI